MTPFHQFTLDNGLQVIVHEDSSIPVVVLNVLYRVGSRNEHKDRTGFAHLFEHLMFGGSRHIPSYDEPLQRVGGENNAFTSQDITTYYMTLPAGNIETGFWLESDRMLGLAFNDRILERERKVVIEEYKQNYLNQPYGDVWLKLCPLSYQHHPYKWPTIGRHIDHIKEASMDDVQDFFRTYYIPNNAVLVVAGNIRLETAKQLCKKWFSPIPTGKSVITNFPAEPNQTEKRVLHIEADVPADALYKSYPMSGRFDKRFYAYDLLADALGRSDSSILHQSLVKEKKIFTSISAQVTGSLDPGLLIISGLLQNNVTCQQAEIELDDLLHQVTTHGLSDSDLEKVKNQYESSHRLEQIDILERALNLAHASLSGDPNYLNQELDAISKTTFTDVQKAAHHIFRKENSNVIYYQSKKGNKEVK